MNGVALLLLAAVTLAVALAWAFVLFRRDAKRTDEVERAMFFRDPPIEKLERDQRLAFHGRVRQQIRVIPPSHSDR